ncbi:MAG: PorT family protein [Prevotellaceae bacterium]|jgi:hypothetical protein|nr:PorT family protein [Prevotellaceae bacterium]
MKKVLLVVTLMLTIGIVANAQLKFGVKAGANISNIAVDADNKVGFNTGVFGEFKISKFAIQPEVLFSMQGAKGADTKFETSYINIPVMAKYYIIKGLSVEAGPQIGFLTSAKFKPTEGDSEDVKEIMKKTDFAINFGASYELPIIPVGVFARYSLGITDLYDKDKLGIDGGDLGKNRVFQIGAFVKF